METSKIKLSLSIKQGSHLFFQGPQWNVEPFLELSFFNKFTVDRCFPVRCSRKKGTWTILHRFLFLSSSGPRNGFLSQSFWSPKYFALTMQLEWCNNYRATSWFLEVLAAKVTEYVSRTSTVFHSPDFIIFTYCTNAFFNIYYKTFFL